MTIRPVFSAIEHGAHRALVLDRIDVALLLVVVSLAS
jgi:hypothetical protein